jgi:diguanylate cyclase (GGDEF)-like protein
MADKILVVDDDPDVALFVEIHLRESGFDVALASRGDEAVEAVRSFRPDLVVLDVMLPGVDGFEVAQRIRSDPRTAGAGIIMLTGRTRSADRVLGLTSGADDYIIKPFDPVELVARVKGLLRRVREMRSASPLTGLPGNLTIQEELGRLVEGGRSFALLYADLDNFKAFNDRYGFLRGDHAIQSAAREIQDVAEQIVGEQAFVGHVGGDDFVMICPPPIAEGLAEAIVDRLDDLIPGLYDPEDRERGAVEVTDRRGVVRRHPLLSVSVGVATTERRRFTHPSEPVNVATEMKEYAKRLTGSSWAVDRRRIEIEGGEPTEP